MPLSRDQLNPLGILGLRKLNFIPIHFATVIIKKTVDINLLEYWIIYHLNSRYAIRTCMTLDDTTNITSVLEIGLEDPKEISMLTLGCPFLYGE